MSEKLRAILECTCWLVFIICACIVLCRFSSCTQAIYTTNHRTTIHKGTGP